MKTKLLKGIGTVVGAILLSTLGIYASDQLRGIDGGLGNLASVRNAGVCGKGTVPYKIDGELLCVDQYEASPSDACPHHVLVSMIQSEQNINTKDCFAASVKDAQPWIFISLPQAQRMCAGVGKRLPTSKEWYQIALGTDPGSCVIDVDKAQKTGTDACVSTAGAHDVVGNVWEWVNETVTGTTFEGRALPNEGYVTSVDVNGVAVTAGEAADDLYGKDYFWSKEDGVFGMIRGGFYGSREDAGLYTINASVLTSFASQGVGFRCVSDVL